MCLGKTVSERDYVTVCLGLYNSGELAAGKEAAGDGKHVKFAPSVSARYQ